jgi:hypothetical protein
VAALFCFFCFFEGAGVSFAIADMGRLIGKDYRDFLQEQRAAPYPNKSDILQLWLKIRVLDNKSKCQDQAAEQAPTLKDD